MCTNIFRSKRGNFNNSDLYAQGFDGIEKADHNIAWRTRSELELDHVPGGVGALGCQDNINYVGAAGNTALQNDFSHPVCSIAGTDLVSDISANLPATRFRIDRIQPGLFMRSLHGPAESF